MIFLIIFRNNLNVNFFAEKGRYLGSPCDVVSSCNSELQHVFC